MTEQPAVSRVSAWLAVPALVLITGLLLLPVCDLLHLCGCRGPWSSADVHCNVHNPQGPRCPWCEHPALGAGVMLGVYGGQWMTLRALRRRGAGWWAAAAGSLAALAPLAVLVGALGWLSTDYPHFLARDARPRLGLPDGPISCVARSPRPAVAACCRN
jgi:hypothetical protein